MITYINTDEVENISNEISSAVQELEDEFNLLFTRLDNVPNVTKEWVGNQANYYFSKVESDKKRYADYVKTIKALSDELDSVAKRAETTIRANNNER